MIAKVLCCSKDPRDSYCVVTQENVHESIKIIYACENLVLKIYRKALLKSSYSRSEPTRVLCRNSCKDPNSTLCWNSFECSWFNYMYENLVLKIYRKAQCMHRVMLCFGICVEKPSSAVIFQNSVLHLYNEYVENMLK